MRFAGSLTDDESIRAITDIRAVLTKAAGKLVLCADARELGVLAPDVSARFIGLFRHDNPKVERSALIVGSEGPGLTEHWQREADVRMTIPMAAGIDSLNVAASVAIACWHFRRQLSQSSSSPMAGETGQSSG